MAKRKNNNMAIVMKVILLVLAGVCFVSLAIPVLKTEGFGTATTISGSQLLENFNEATGSIIGDAQAVQAYTAMQWTYLIALIASGVMAVSVVLSFVLGKLGIGLAKIASIVAVLASIALIICGYVHVGKVGLDFYTLSFMPWFMFMMSTVFSITAFAGFRK